jgi:hypothetical protein
VGWEIFLFTTASRTTLGPIQPPIQWVAGALFLGLKRPGREADQLPPSSAEVNTAWSYTSTPQQAFMAWCLVKHSDNFTFIRQKLDNPPFTISDAIFIYTSFVERCFGSLQKF